MSFSYHPPTRKKCKVCEEIVNKHASPLIATAKGRASSADNFPFHNWYNFVLGYSPKFPDYIIERENLGIDGLIADPFMGSGTTLICARDHGFKSIGIDANDFFNFTAQTKLEWNINTKIARKIESEILTKLSNAFAEFKFPETTNNQNLFQNNRGKSYKIYADKHRINALPERYISDAPLTRLLILKEIIANENYPNKLLKNIFLLAFTTIVLPASNVYYGPGFGVKKPKVDVDVLGLFKKKIDRIITDLENVDSSKNHIDAVTCLGDARKMSKSFKKNSIDLMITSPPYPGDHEYTKHSKLELIFMNFATNLDDFRVIKKRMLRGSTTNIYKDDFEGELVKDSIAIKKITDTIDKRLKADGATSGFEKLYTKLVWEYFGGMFTVFREAIKVLKPGGKFVLLVSDSHAFKMVHIKTADLLAETAIKAGMINPQIELWQNKQSTSHKYNLFEEILTIEKPIK